MSISPARKMKHPGSHNHHLYQIGDGFIKKKVKKVAG